MIKIYKITLTVIVILIANPIFAQMPDILPKLPSAGPVPPATPIDGGLSLLLAGAAAYGIQKLRNGLRRD